MSIMPDSRDWDQLCRQFHKAHAQLRDSGTIGDWCRAKKISRAVMFRKYRAWKERLGI